MTSWNNSHKQQQACVNGITRFRRNLPHADTNRKPHASCQEAFSRLGCRIRTFLQSAYQRLALIGLQQEADKWPKCLKSVELPPSTWEANLQVSLKPRSINLEMEGLIYQNSERRARRGSNHTMLTNYRPAKVSLSKAVHHKWKSHSWDNKQLSSFTKKSCQTSPGVGIPSTGQVLTVPQACISKRTVNLWPLCK